MPRRKLVFFVAGAVAALAMFRPGVLGAQQIGKPKRIVFISSVFDEGLKARLSCFKEGLASLGWTEGSTVAIEFRSAEGRAEALPGLAEEANRLKPDVVVTNGTPAAQAVKRVVRDVPVVFTMVSDPVASGIVKSLARPEANVTGYSNFLPATTEKLLEVIREIAPGASRIAFPHDPANPGKRLELQVLRGRASGLGISIEPHELRSLEDVESAFAAMSKAPPDALLVPIDAMTLGATQRIVAFAATIRRPAIYQTREFVEAGGLMSYGLDVCRHHRGAASHVDRILRGAKPGNLPVEQPTTFEFVLNRKTARALGLKLPASVLARIDRVIE